MKKIWIFCLTGMLSAFFLTGCQIAKYGINYTKLEEPRYAALNLKSPDVRDANVLKVVTYNIEFAKRIDKAINILDTYPELKDADILLLQEMDDQGVDQIARTLGYNYIYYPAVFHPLPRQNFGNAILSKWPIISDEKIILDAQDTNKLQRIAAIAYIQVGNKKVMVGSTHMRIRLEPFVRQRQIKRIIRSIPKDIHYSIIAGDFNTFHPISMLEVKSEFKDFDYTFVTEDIGWTHRTIYTFFKKSSTDHIFSRGFRPKKTGKVTTRKASDHLPVWATLEFQ